MPRFFLKLARRVLTLLILSLTVVASAMADGSWTTFRGPQGAGEATQGLPEGDGPLALELAWKRPLGSGYSGISIADHKLVTAFTDGEEDLVVALDPTTGEEIWRYDLAPVYDGHDGSHNGPIATPAIADGRVFMVDPWGHVAALDLATGEALWTTHLVVDFGSKSQYYGFASSPVVVGDTVVLQIGGEGGAVVGLDVASGELRWRSFEDEVMAQSPILATIGGAEQVLVLGSTKLAGLDPSSGAVLWEFAHEGEPGPMGSWTSSPLPLGGDRIFLKYEDPSSAVIALTEADGTLSAQRLAKSRGLTRSYSPAALSGDHVYGFTARFLSAVDPQSGELLWRSREVGDGFLISVGGHLAVLQKTGSLHLGAASPEGWSETARLELFDDLAWTPPSYADGSLYMRSFGEIARVDLVRSEPALIADLVDGAIPAALVGLAEDVASSDDAPGVVDRFLDGRELPLIDGEQVVFLWRGDAEDVAVAGDMIGMRREEPMNRLASTDLWWWQTELDRRARISYLFITDYAPSTDPSNDRRVTSTVLGPDMNWRRDESVEMSWFAMPDWPGSTAEAGGTGRGGRLETIQVTIQPAPLEGEEQPEALQIPVHVWLPPGYDESDERYPVVYVHNADARQAGGWPQTLDRVVGESVEPLIAVFPEMPRMPGLRGTFVGQIVPRIDELYRTRTDRDSRASIGMGWPGFVATSIAFGNPEIFGAIGVQSMYMLTEQMNTVEKAIGKQNADTLSMRIYLEWGRWDLISPHEEMNMRASSQWAWEMLKSKGWDPLGGEVWDSTDFASWGNRTDVMLEQLFPLDGAESRLSDWQTGR